MKLMLNYNLYVPTEFSSTGGLVKNRYFSNVFRIRIQILPVKCI